MTRSIQKGPFVDESIIRKIKAIKTAGKDLIKTPITTYSRRSVIISNFIGLTFKVHNGKKFLPVKIKETMVGFKLGEFSPTRFFTKHSGNKGKSLGLTKKRK